MPPLYAMKLKEELQRDPDLSYDRAVQLARGWEQIRQGNNGRREAKASPNNDSQLSEKTEKRRRISGTCPFRLHQASQHVAQKVPQRRPGSSSTQRWSPQSRFNPRQQDSDLPLQGRSHRRQGKFDQDRSVGPPNTQNNIGRIDSKREGQ